MIPKLYRAAEVCEATGVQPYVLRSWEKEFPGIGVQKSPESARLYRESDIQQIRQIKQLVFGEGLTLAGARRRLVELSPRPAEVSPVDMDEVFDTLGADARSRIDVVRTGLRSILEVLSKRAGTSAIPELPRNGSSREHRRAAQAQNSTSEHKSRSPKRVAAKRGATARKARSTKRKRSRQGF